MSSLAKEISLLHSIRNKYGSAFQKQKQDLLASIDPAGLTARADVLSFYETLNFFCAYPDNEEIYSLARNAMKRLSQTISRREGMRKKLFNSGVISTKLRVSYSFEVVKWLHHNFPQNVSIGSIEGDDSVVQSVLSTVLPKVESEILQDANENWKSWIKKTKKPKQDTFSKLVAIFDQADLRPEVRDELWNALGVDVQIELPSRISLPESLIQPYYHDDFLRTEKEIERAGFHSLEVRLKGDEPKKIIDCAKWLMAQNFREMDPITFASDERVRLYRLSRGFSVAFTEMVVDRRHPIDSYMSYIAFKNGMPISYGGSWLLFDSSRFAFNIFPSYRGGESIYAFNQLLRLHAKVFRLCRLSVDSYQIGKENSDGIHSGAFWVWYKAGYRPMKEEQRVLAESEAKKISRDKKYRSPISVLKKLADSRMELILNKKAFRFDAGDYSLAYAGILKKMFGNDRKKAEEYCFKKLTTILRIKNAHHPEMNYVLKNWCVLLISREDELRRNKKLQTQLRNLFQLKAEGEEMKFIFLMQGAKELRKLMTGIAEEFAG